jgi:hypothetical protein
VEKKMNNIQELIKTKPEMFDYPDCSDKPFIDPMADKKSFDLLPDYLKKALDAARAKKQPDQSAQPA